MKGKYAVPEIPEGYPSGISVFFFFAFNESHEKDLSKFCRGNVMFRCEFLHFLVFVP